MAAERFTRMHIGNMYFNHRQVDSRNGIPQSDGGMCITAGIKDHTLGPGTRFMQLVDQLPLDIGLPGTHLKPHIITQVHTLLNNFIQSHFAVHTWFANTHQVQVGSI